MIVPRLSRLGSFIAFHFRDELARAIGAWQKCNATEVRGHLVDRDRVYTCIHACGVECTRVSVRTRRERRCIRSIYRRRELSHTSPRPRCCIDLLTKSVTLLKWIS